MEKAVYKTNNGKNENEIDKEIDCIINKQYENRKKEKAMLNIKYLKDNTYNVFNAIFSGIEFENIKGQKIKNNDIQDFHKFQIELNSNYKSTINVFDYKNKKKFPIIKEIPYKATRLRKISDEDTAISISPNGIFALTSTIENSSQSSSLFHYNTIIGNAIIVRGVYYYEVKILELGKDTDLFIGFISKDCQILTDNKLSQLPIGEFKDGYALNFNNHYELKYTHNKRDLLRKEIIFWLKLT